MIGCWTFTSVTGDRLVARRRMYPFVVDVVSTSVVDVSKLSSTVALCEPSVEASRLKESSVRVESSSTACWTG